MKHFITVFQIPVINNVQFTQMKTYEDQIKHVAARNKINTIILPFVRDNY